MINGMMFVHDNVVVPFGDSPLLCCFLDMHSLEHVAHAFVHIGIDRCTVFLCLELFALYCSHPHGTNIHVIHVDARPSSDVLLCSCLVSRLKVSS